MTGITMRALLVGSVENQGPADSAFAALLASTVFEISVVDDLAGAASVVASSNIDVVVVSQRIADDDDLNVEEALLQAGSSSAIVLLTDRPAMADVDSITSAGIMTPERTKPIPPVIYLRDSPLEDRLVGALHQIVLNRRTATLQQKMLANVSDTVTLLDEQGRILHTTGHLREILGRPPSYWRNRSAFDLCHPDDREAAAEQFATLLTSPNTEIRADFRGAHADGHWEYLELTGVNLLDDPLMNAIVVTTRNVTDRKLVEQELAAERDEATARSEAKSEFVAGVVHELRSPLHVVLGLSELLAQSHLPSEPASLAGRIHSEARKLGRVLDDILDIAQIEARRMTLHTASFSISELIDDVVAAHSLAAGPKDVAIDSSTELLRADVRVGDSGRLRQILMNLVGNAVKFTDAGRISIEISESDEQADGVSFVVADTGIGVEPELVGSLFEPFSAASTVTSRTHGGSGLGLSIARQLVELMGGEQMTVSTMVGLGSSFSFTVPLPPGEVSRRPHRAESEWSNVQAALVLVVEDNLVNQQLVAKQLEVVGHNHQIASTGEQATAMAFADDFDAILMDLELPGIDGLEATRRIRKRELGSDRRIPIIAMTASAMAGDRERCLNAGMDDFVAKPVGLDRLAAVLTRWVISGPTSPGSWRPPRAEPPGEPVVLDDQVLRRHAEDLGGFDIVGTSIRTYLDGLPGRTSALLAAIDTGDAEGTRKLAHDLRSASLLIGAKALSGICADLEANREATDSQVLELTRITEATSEALEAFHQSQIR